MKLTCIHCGHTASSVILDKNEALAEIMLNFSKHLMQNPNPKHKEATESLVKDMAFLTQVATTIAVLAKHTTLLDMDLEPGNYIQEQFSEMLQTLQDILGVEISDNKPMKDLLNGNLDKSPTPMSLGLVPPKSA